MRRKDREMSEAFALEVVDKAPYATLALMDSAEQPYAIPISIVRIAHNIYIHSAKVGRKIACIDRNAKVCLVCVSDVEPLVDEFSTAYKSAIVTGHIALVEDRAEAIAALRALTMRYTPACLPAFDEEIANSFSRTAVYRIAIETISGKANVT